MSDRASRTDETADTDQTNADTDALGNACDNDDDDDDDGCRGHHNH